jgi:hypothetical protein
MYPRIHRELVGDPLGSAEHTLGNTSLERTCGVGLQPNFAVLDKFLKQLKHKYFLNSVQLYVLCVSEVNMQLLVFFTSASIIVGLGFAYLERTFMSTVLAVM